ncbi:hypothetical protein MKZ08_11130 [Viridibacillus sp. FSL R5-0477]|uniref:Lipoprotein n=1 Tax=Viridibacillus arenosi FSL R5-213 TaxID=1227360 RepID=W4F344_9BACL|nr:MULTISPECIES: hypothetical protein [Viridibacillus]ETT86456.1 hypothetical protein C176_07077 [Viridibacillus arenosi FSL R5-213]OMC86081.1 hypothetical protein BK128_13745 [Viridibacillus sp. FSL H7-0596]OMC91710.1 hypothetical protein BK137_07265 [Viridibacillus arenosi]
MKNYIIVSIGLLLICGCSQTSSKESKGFMEIIGDISVSKIEVIDGRTGERHSTTEDENIEQFYQLLSEREYKEMKNHEKVKGYIYCAVLYSGKKDFNVTFLDDEIDINGTYYSLNNPILEEDIFKLLE